MTSDEISKAISDKSKEILAASERLDTVQRRQFRIKKLLVEISESIRQGKYLLDKLRREEKQLERDIWPALKRERGY